MTQAIQFYKIQNVDRIARASDYAHLKRDELLVHGIFGTLQGEGPYVGTPCVFVRLAGCNFGHKLHFCEFCDTDFRLESGKVMTFEQVMQAVTKEWEKIGFYKKRPLIVLTGGEPGLQPSTYAFIIEATQTYGWAVQVETNGTQHKFANLLKDFFNGAHDEELLTLVISPKAAPTGYGALDIKTWAWGSNCLKVLVDKRNHYSQLPEYLAEWAATGQDIYLSPIAVYAKEYKGEISSAWEDGLVDRELTRQNYNFAATLCKRMGFKLSIQQHIFAEIE